MAKVKSQAMWNRLSPEQRKTLDEWLFEDGLSYEAILKRTEKELGFTSSKSSLARYYKHAAAERILSGFTDAAKLASSVESTPVSLEQLRNSGLKVAAQIFLRMVTERPNEPQAWMPLARLLSQNEKNESWRATKEAENKIRRDTLQFSQVRFQYDNIAAALKMLPKLQEFQEERDEEEMTVYERNKRMNDLRKGMFGEAIPELLPENEEEEAHPEIIEQRFREAYQRQQEQFIREYHERQREFAEAEARKRQVVSKETRPDDEDEDESDDNSDPGEENSEEEVPEAREQANEEPVPAPDDLPDAEPANLAGAVPPETAPEKEQETMSASESAPPESQAAEELVTEPAGEFIDEPRKPTPEERQREYADLMRRARGKRW